MTVMLGVPKASKSREHFEAQASKYASGIPESKAGGPTGEVGLTKHLADVAGDDPHVSVKPSTNATGERRLSSDNKLRTKSLAPQPITIAPDGRNQHR